MQTVGNRYSLVDWDAPSSRDWERTVVICLPNERSLQTGPKNVVIIALAYIGSDWTLISMEYDRGRAYSVGVHHGPDQGFHSRNTDVLELMSDMIIIMGFELKEDFEIPLNCLNITENIVEKQTNFHQILPENKKIFSNADTLVR